jgi:hypothetical protein
MAAHMARSIDGEGSGTGRLSSRARGACLRWACRSWVRGATRETALGVLLAVGGLAGCRCTPKHASELARADFDTPRHTLDAFRAYASADLYDLEYRCFSRAFTRTRQISVLNYSEARADLKRRQPWLFWFDSEVVAERELDERQHVLDVRVAGRTVRVKLVREETFRIWAGEELLNDGPLALSGALTLVDGPSGRSMLTATLPTGEAAVDPTQITRVTLERCWKIDDLIDDPGP